MPITHAYRPAPHWQELGEGFSDTVEAASFPEKILRFRHPTQAKLIGLDQLTDSQWLQHFADFTPLPNNLPQPQALRYHGHQFTHYNSELGDGRGFLFAQVQHQDRLLDLGTKGSGLTPYSRQGDGRLTLKGAIREALATAMLESWEVDTSKTFSIVETGENLYRNDEPSPTRSAVLVRLSHSHIRFGTFQRLAFLKELKNMRKLLDYCLNHYYPGCTPEDFFNQVCARVAKTTAQWMVHGFVHGVLNTDNLNITGESFDYGPYRFLPHYDPQFTAAYFDHQSLYAFGRQPTMVLWNLERLAEALSPLFSNNEIFLKGYETFKKDFSQELVYSFAKKIGLDSKNNFLKMQNLFYLCLQFLEKSKAPYTAFFHHLYCWHQDLKQPLHNYSPYYQGQDLIDDIGKELGQLYRNPHACIKDVHQWESLEINEIESIWSAISTQNNWNIFNQKMTKLLSSAV